MMRAFKIEGSLNLIPIIGGTLIFSSLVLNLGYYSLFQISITNYLSLSEILTLFFEDIIPIAFLIALLISFTSFPISIFSTTKKTKTTKFSFNIKHIVSSVPGLLLICSSAVLYLYNEHYLNKASSIKIDLAFLPLIYLALFSSFLYGLWLMWKHIEDNFLSSLTSYIWILAFLFSLFYCMGIYKGATVLGEGKNRSHFYKFILKDNSQIIIDTSKVYLGKTNSSFFYYDYLDKSSHVISSDQIIELVAYNRRAFK